MDHIECGQHKISLVGIAFLEITDKRTMNLINGKTKEVFSLKITYGDSVFTETFDDQEARDTVFHQVRAGVEQRASQMGIFEK